MTPTQDVLFQAALALREALVRRGLDNAGILQLYTGDTAFALNLLARFLTVTWLLP